MSTREELLKLLEANKGNYFSGEEIAGLLSVSRAAVWKAVNALRKEGYSIQAVTNRGYSLAPDTDILSVPGILKYLKVPDLEIHVTATAESTNRQVRLQAEAGGPEGYLLLANGQTGGRGRSGREFFSPEDTGLYMSLLLRPDTDSTGLTTMAAVAMCRAMETVTGLTPGIKWVNDILLEGRKICGILTEGAFSMESGCLDYAILGVGVNVYPPREGFPEDLREIAGALLDRPGDDVRNRLAAEFLNEFYACYRGQKAYTEAYRDYSLVLGREVTVLAQGQERQALVLGIDDRCRLQLRYEDGREDCLSYGEIRIRL